MLALPDHFLGTYQKMLLHDWPEMSAFIQKDTRWVKETLKKTVSVTKSILLTNQQLNDAFNGPFQHFFQQHLKTYLDISRIITALTFTTGDFIKDKEHIDNIRCDVPEKLLQKADAAALKEKKTHLTQIAETHHNEWEKYIQQWTKTFVETLQNAGLPLSDIELQDFSNHEPVSEINDRFIHLNIALPKLKNLPFNFYQYFQLKLTLLAHSALSRLQKQNTEKDIEQALKPLQQSLKVLRQTEEDLIKTHQNTLNQFTSDISIHQKK